MIAEGENHGNEGVMRGAEITSEVFMDLCESLSKITHNLFFHLERT